MINKNKIISSIVLVCFLVNSVVTDIAFGQSAFSQPSDKLAQQTKFSNILQDIEAMDIGDIELWFVAALNYISHQKLDITKENLQKFADMSGNMPGRSIFKLKNAQFLIHEIGTTDDGSLKIRAKRNDLTHGSREYFIEYSNKGNGTLHVYPKDKPRERTEKDRRSIDTYKQHEKVDEILDLAHRNDLTLTAKEAGFDYRAAIMEIISELKLYIKNPYSMIPIQDREFFIVPITDEIDSLLKENRIEHETKNGTKQKIVILAHSSNNAVHIFLSRDAIDDLKKSGARSKFASNRIKEYLVHEVGVMLGLPILKFIDGRPENEIDERYNELLLKSRKAELGLAKYSIVDLDTNLAMRDYAAGKANPRGAENFGGLVLDRMLGESIIINENIEVIYDDQAGRQAKITIIAPDNVGIQAYENRLRLEAWDTHKKETRLTTRVIRRNDSEGIILKIKDAYVVIHIVKTGYGIKFVAQAPATISIDRKEVAEAKRLRRGGRDRIAAIFAQAMQDLSIIRNKAPNVKLGNEIDSLFSQIYTMLLEVNARRLSDSDEAVPGDIIAADKPDGGVRFFICYAPHEYIVLETTSLNNIIDIGTRHIDIRMGSFLRLPVNPRRLIIEKAPLLKKLEYLIQKINEMTENVRLKSDGRKSSSRFMTTEDRSGGVPAQAAAESTHPDKESALSPASLEDLRRNKTDKPENVCFVGIMCTDRFHNASAKDLLPGMETDSLSLAGNIRDSIDPDGSKTRAYIDGLPADTKALLSDSSRVISGGPATSSARVCKQLAGEGVNASLVTAVGRDGDSLVAEHKKLGVDMSSAEVILDKPTAKTLVYELGQGKRSFLHDIGASAGLTLKSLRREDFAGKKVVEFGGIELSGLMPDLDRALLMAKDEGCITVLDTVVDRPHQWKGFREKYGSMYLEKILGLVDVFTPSFGEAVQIYADYMYPKNAQAAKELERRILDGKEMTPAEIAAFFIGHGAKAVFLKKGTDGVYVDITRGSIFKEVKDGTEFHIPILRGFADVNNTGTGDAFSGALVYAVAKGWSARKTALFADVVGGMCVQHEGGTIGDESLVDALYNMERLEKQMITDAARAAYRYISISMGGDKLAASIVDGNNNVIGETVEIRWAQDTRFNNKQIKDKTPEKAAEVMDTVKDLAAELLRKNRVNSSEIKMENAGLAGPLDKEAGVFGSDFPTPNLPFNKYPFRPELDKRMRSIGVNASKIVMVNDGEAARNGEHYSPRGKLVGKIGGIVIIGGGINISVDGDDSIKEAGHNLYEIEGEAGDVHYVWGGVGSKGGHPIESGNTPESIMEKCGAMGEEYIRLGESAFRKKYPDYPFIAWARGLRDFEDKLSGTNIRRRVGESVEANLDKAGYNQLKTIAFDETLVGKDKAGQYERALTIAALRGNSIARDWIRKIGEEVGVALAAFVSAYSNKPFAENLVLVSGVNENLGKGVDEVSGVDLYMRSIRENMIREMEMYFHVEHDRALRIAEGVVRSDLTYERELVSYRPTDEEVLAAMAEPAHAADAAKSKYVKVTNEQGYQIINLTNDDNNTMKIVPGVSATIMSMVVGGREILRYPKGEITSVGGIPAPFFIFSGRVKNGKFLWKGKEKDLTKYFDKGVRKDADGNALHGILDRAQWSVESSGPTEPGMDGKRGAYAILTYDAGKNDIFRALFDEENAAASSKLRLIYTLMGDELTIKYSVTNDGSAEFPNYTNIHPWIDTDGKNVNHTNKAKTRIVHENYFPAREEAVMGQFDFKTPRPIEGSFEEVFADIGADQEGNSVSTTILNDGTAVDIVQNVKEFPLKKVWVNTERSVVSDQPLSGRIGSLGPDKEAACDTIKPGEKREWTFAMKVRKQQLSGERRPEGLSVTLTNEDVIKILTTLRIQVQNSWGTGRSEALGAVGSALEDAKQGKPITSILSHLNKCVRMFHYRFDSQTSYNQLQKNQMGDLQDILRQGMERILQVQSAAVKAEQPGLGKRQPGKSPEAAKIAIALSPTLKKLLESQGWFTLQDFLVGHGEVAKAHPELGWTSISEGQARRDLDTLAIDDGTGETTTAIVTIDRTEGAYKYSLIFDGTNTIADPELEFLQKRTQSILQPAASGPISGELPIDILQRDAPTMPIEELVAQATECAFKDSPKVVGAIREGLKGLPKLDDFDKAFAKVHPRYWIINNLIIFAKAKAHKVLADLYSLYPDHVRDVLSGPQFEDLRKDVDNSITPHGQLIRRSMLEEQDHNEKPLPSLREPLKIHAQKDDMKGKVIVGSQERSLPSELTAKKIVAIDEIIAALGVKAESVTIIGTARSMPVYPVDSSGTYGRYEVNLADEGLIIKIAEAKSAESRDTSWSGQLGEDTIRMWADAGDFANLIIASVNQDDMVRKVLNEPKYEALRKQYEEAVARPQAAEQRLRQEINDLLIAHEFGKIREMLADSTRGYLNEKKYFSFELKLSKDRSFAAELALMRDILVDTPEGREFLGSEFYAEIPGVPRVILANDFGFPLSVYKPISLSIASDEALDEISVIETPLLDIRNKLAGMLNVIPEKIRMYTTTTDNRFIVEVGSPGALRTRAFTIDVDSKGQISFVHRKSAPAADETSLDQESMDILEPAGINHGRPSVEILEREVLDAARAKSVRSLAQAVAAVQSAITQAIANAFEAAREIPTAEDKRYKILVDNNFFRGNERELDIEGYDLPDGKHIGAADRFYLGQVDTSNIENILAYVDEPDRTVVQVSRELSDAELKALKERAPGIIVVRIDTTYFKNGELDDIERRNCRFDIYDMLLHARRITRKDVEEHSAIYQGLKFRIDTHVKEEDKLNADEYIEAILSGDFKGMSYIVKHNLSYRPMGRWKVPEYHAIAAALISA